MLEQASANWGQSAQAAPGENVDANRATHELRVMELWRSAGRDLVTENWGELQSLIDHLDDLIERGKYAEAAASAQVAANFAVFWHAGVFSSPRLEEAIRKLGQRAIPSLAPKAARHDGTNLAILHVVTELSEIGGHTRMITRWVGHDNANVHSVAATRQHEPTPARLKDVISSTGGSIIQLNLEIGGILDWARNLQELIVKADLVIFHVHNMDVIPFLALSGLRNRPPVAMVNHSDHLFWIGVSFVDHVICTRRSGLKLCVDRRGVSPDQAILLPLCLEPMKRLRSREQAKETLHLPPDSVVLLTIARALKFRPLDGENFCEPLLPLILSNSKIHFIVIGPRGDPGWDRIERLASGRIKVLPETKNTQIYLEAADVYVDSFPFVSITSMFEAGLYGTPLVTRVAFGPGCEIMAADSPGLDAVIVRANSAQELREVVTRLAESPESRKTIGFETVSEISSTNFGHNWIDEVQNIYDIILNNSHEFPKSILDDFPRMEDVDLFLPFVYGDATKGASLSKRRAYATEHVLKVAPLRWRLRELFALVGRHEFSAPIWKYLIPEWAGCHARRYLRRRGS